MVASLPGVKGPVGCQKPLANPQCSLKYGCQMFKYICSIVTSSVYHLFNYSAVQLQFGQLIFVQSALCSIKLVQLFRSVGPCSADQPPYEYSVPGIRRKSSRVRKPFCCLSSEVNRDHRRSIWDDVTGKMRVNLTV